MGEYKEHLAYLQNVTEQALESCGYDGLWIYSGHPVNYFLDDMPPPQAINPHFKWWVPIAYVSSSVLQIRPGHKPRLYLLQPDDFWHTVIDHSQEKWIKHFDLQVISHYSQLPKFHDFKNHAWIGSSELQPLDPSLTNPRELLDFIHDGRTRKTTYEINCITKANQIAMLGHKAAEDAFFAGASEFETHMAYMEATAHNEKQLPYGNIVAQNQNAAVLHYQYQSRERLLGNDRLSFLIDAGAKYNGYASDITRTYTTGNGLFSELLSGMQQLQTELCGACVVGQDYAELHNTAHLKISQLLSEHKVLSCGAEEAVDSRLSGVFFPHGLGHFLGLQVHDVNGHVIDSKGTLRKPPEHYPFLRLTHELQENMVLTIEPGLYFIPMLLNHKQGDSRINWDLVESLLPYGGIRIEDNIWVTADGAVNITRS